MARTWIYATSTADNDEAARYLNTQVIRPVIQCGRFENEVTIQPTPLPPQTPQQIEDDFAYLKSTTRSGVEGYDNVGLHVKRDLPLILVNNGVNNSGGGGNSGNNGGGDSGGEYLLNLPLITGTVIAYSPPPEHNGTYRNGGNDNSVDDGSSEVEQGYEFDPSREKHTLYRILWHSTTNGMSYLEDVTEKELASNAFQSSNKTSKLIQSQAACAVHKSIRAIQIRQRLALQWRIEGLLRQLVVLAALELRREVGNKVRLEILLERRGRSGVGKGGKGEVNECGGDFGYYTRHPNQYMSSFQPPPPLTFDDDEDTESFPSKRSKKLSPTELAKYNTKLSTTSFAPSKIAERVKLACTMAHQYALSNGLLDDYLEKEEGRRERERCGRDEMSSTAREGEVRRSSRAKSTVNYADDGAVENILKEHEGMSSKNSSSGGRDFPKKEVSGGPCAIYLLQLLGFDKNSNEHDELDHEAEEEEEDPFFAPDPCHVLDQLGRKQRYMSPANIQEAICHNIDGEGMTTPTYLLDEEQIDKKCAYVSDIVCLTDDKIEDLPQFEPASFARCRFGTRTYPESDDVEEVENDQAKAEAQALAKKAREERQKARNAKLENIYRAKKSFEFWRFRSIHGNGCAVWPSWFERSKDILKDLFVLSRVNSMVDLVEGQPGVGAGENSNSQNVESGVTGDQENKDEALAKSLADAEVTEGGEPLAKRRRTTRRAAGGDEPVFYGSHQSMSREQLLSTLVRLLLQAKPGSSSIMQLKQLIFATDYEASRGEAVEWRKLRSALGHLVFRTGRLGRLLVDVDGDAACRELLKDGALVKFEPPPATKTEANEDATEPIPPPAAADEELIKKLTALETYVQNLHITELSLRAALMKAIDKGGQSGESILQISTMAISTAADEVEGDAAAEDWSFFTDTDENKEEITWDTTGHTLLNQIIFRPPSSPISSSESKQDRGQKCQWYKVVSYTASVKGEEATSEETTKQSQDPNAVEPNPVVERRMRFRAIPIAASDIESQMDIEYDANDADYMVLTESQVRAGMEAAILHRKISANSRAKEEQSSKPISLNTHPFKNKTGSKVMLTPLSENGEVGSEISYGVIAGHEHLTENNGIKSKVLILLENQEEGAFWSTVNAEGTTLTEIAPDPKFQSSLCSNYKIDMHEYFEGSEAYKCCEAVLKYTKDHARSKPFSEPVDPVALGLPDYFDVIKSPMDISTLAKNLKDGKYSRIPPKTTSDEDENPLADHPVCKMVYGPFYEDLMRIFDNAILYNHLDSWIGKEADLMRKNVVRKADQVVNKATSSWYRQESKAASTKKSMYADEDSDVDMYEYESDYDDEEGGKSKPGKGRAKRAPKPRVEDDIASKAIEKPYTLPESVVDFNISGSFPHMKIQTNVSRFALPLDWSCRHVLDETGNETGVADAEDEEMLSLLQMQQEDEVNVRRSSRARSAPKTYTDDVMEVATTNTPPTSQEPIVLPGAEYYIINDDLFQLQSEISDPNTSDTSLLPTSSKSRVGVEGVCETLHEQFYAKLYRLHSPNAMILDNELGKYIEGSFPPYLGRVFDTSSDVYGGSIVWEIREQYVIPALRWVLRGLVRSGHLAEVDGSLSEGISADNDVTITGPRAGMAFSFGPGVVVPNHEYYINEKFEPFEVLDEKEILRKRRVQAGASEEESSDEEVELSAYEKMRAERVARNAERLKQLGLA